MIEIINKGRMLTYADVYFTDSAVNTISQKCDICTYHNIYDLHDEKNKYFTEYTLISDLTENEDDLWCAIHKKTRYEIRRAERYDIQFVYYDSNDIINGSEFNFADFSKMYEKMFESKDLPRLLDKNEFYGLINARGGTITAAIHNEKALVYHFYINDNEHTKLTISCSELWTADSQIDKNMIGYANKWLHWKDFLYFKEIGVESYDWGGVTWNEEDQGKLEGINKFKASFGGKPVSYFCETVVISNKAKLIKILSRIKKLL
ncbi:MAG: hypothetical protein IJS03_06840 [Eubacterium sp.]|nr:hypothetical protein [Eubacterium sp.]